MATTQSLRFENPAGSALAGATVNITAHGTTSPIVATGTTDSDGYLVPAPSLTEGDQYDFTTNSPAVPGGSFTAQMATVLVLIPGPPGPKGDPGDTGATGATGSPGGTGPQGDPGPLPYTTTTNPATVPNVGGSVTLAVSDGDAFSIPARILVATTDLSQQFFATVTAASHSSITATCTYIETGSVGSSLPTGTTVSISGARGLPGTNGTNGSAGADGHGSTFTTANITIPAVNSTVSVPVTDATAFPNGTIITVSDGTNGFVGEVTAGGTTTPLTVKNLNVIAGSAVGNTVNSGATFSFGGTSGADGHGSTTTTSNVTIPAINSTVSVPVVDGTAFPDGATLVVSDGTNGFIGLVTAGGTSSPLTVKNQQVIPGSAVGNTVNSGATVSFSGPVPSGSNVPVGSTIKVAYLSTAVPPYAVTLPNDGGTYDIEFRYHIPTNSASGSLTLSETTAYLSTVYTNADPLDLQSGGVGILVGMATGSGQTILLSESISGGDFTTHHAVIVITATRTS